MVPLQHDGVRPRHSGAEAERRGAPALYFFFFLRSLWRIGNEGSIVYGAQRIAEGGLPCRDFFEVMGRTRVRLVRSRCAGKFYKSPD